MLAGGAISTWEIKGIEVSQEGMPEASVREKKKTSGKRPGNAFLRKS